jgi:hypothetical protein
VIRNTRGRIFILQTPYYAGERPLTPHNIMAKVVKLTLQNRLARLFEVVALVRATRTHDKARNLLEEGLAAYPGDPRFVQSLARLLAASPDAHVRDGAQALRLSQKLYAQFPIVGNAETLAMAHAELDQFKQAIALQ